MVLKRMVLPLLLLLANQAKSLVSDEDSVALVQLWKSKLSYRTSREDPQDLRNAKIKTWGQDKEVAYGSSSWFCILISGKEEVISTELYLICCMRLFYQVPDCLTSACLTACVLDTLQHERMFLHHHQGQMWGGDRDKNGKADGGAEQW